MFVHGIRRVFRSPISNAILFLLLAASVTTFMLGVIVYFNTASQIQSVKKNYTLLVSRKSTIPPQSDTLSHEQLSSLVLNSEHVISENLGRVLVGTSEHWPVSTNTLQPGSPSTLYDDDRSIVMVEVICEASWLTEAPLGFMRHEGKNIQTITMLDMATVHIENILAAHPAYREMPNTLTVYSYLATSDGTSLFVPGERYILIARYSPPTYVTYGRDLVEQSSGSLNIPSTWLGESFGIINVREDGKGLAASDGLRNIAVLSPDDTRIHYLQSWVERCNASLAVWGVDSFDHMVFFHEGMAVLTQGKTFSTGDTNPVCIVSETYATANGLSIGDSLYLDLYQAPFTGDDQTRASYILDHRSPCVQSLNVTIIGLYDMDWKDGENNRYGFNINTIFVPRLILCEEGNAYSTFSNLGLTGQQIINDSHLRGNLPLALETISIKPDHQEVYMIALETHELGDDFELYDGGYSRIAGALNAVHQNATILAILCLIVWISLALITLIIHAIRLRAECRTLRLLGTPKMKTYCFTLGATLPVVLISALAGSTLGGLLCFSVLNTLRTSASPSSGAFSTELSIDTLLHMPEPTDLLFTTASALIVMLLLAISLNYLALPSKTLIRKEAE